MVAVTALPAPKGDAEILGAGTTLRFVLLLVLISTNSSLMISNLLGRWYDPRGQSIGCYLASGENPDSGFWTNVASSHDHNHSALKACLNTYQPSWWASALWLVILVAASAALYWWLPSWKGRRGRLVPVEEMDRQGELKSLLGNMVAVAGLRRAPRFVIDPVAATTSAVVFGRLGRHTVCLHGGLIARRSADVDGFRAVVLHELAHIRNGDVGITYATVALWRVFLVAVLFPNIVNDVGTLLRKLSFPADSIRWVYWRETAPTFTRDVLLSMFMVGLVYLSRADVLRCREVYADLAALSWGAARGSWHHSAEGRTVSGRIKSMLGFLTELWRTHPRWELRQRSLTDPSALFGIQSLPPFLIGAAAALVTGALALSSPPLPDVWANYAEPWLAAGLVAGIVGVAMWRAVSYAVHHARPVPSGFSTGLWLGCGLVTGELLLAESGGNQWFPSNSVALLALVLLAVIATCWTAQCAQLWTTTLRGRMLRPMVALTLAGTWIVLSAGIAWWSQYGDVYLDSSTSAGWSNTIEQWTRQAYPNSPIIHSVLLSTYTHVFSLVDTFYYHLAILWAGMALWLLPLLAWLTPSIKALPPLRRVLGAALLGAASSWVAVVGAMAYMHSWTLSSGPRDGLFDSMYWILLLVAMTVGPVATAALVGTVVPGYRLLVALTSAGVSAVFGFAGTFLLAAFDGCLGPLNTLTSLCEWRPGAAWSFIGNLAPLLLGGGLFASAGAALLAIAVVSLVGMLIQRKTKPSAWRRTENQSGSPAIRAASVAVICVTAFGLVGPTQPRARSASSNTDSKPDRLVSTSAAPGSSPTVRKAQLAAWYIHGGGDLLNSFSGLVTSWASVSESNNASLRPVCAKLTQWAKQADTYFTVPDPQMQPLWSKMIAQTQKGSTDCQSALQQANAPLLVTSTDELEGAMRVATLLFEEFLSETK